MTRKRLVELTGKSCRVLALPMATMILVACSERAFDELSSDARVADASTGDGSTTGDGSQPDGPVSYLCRDSRDEVRSGRCTRKDFVCSDELNRCDEGYACVVNACICEDLRLCGVDCSGGETCPTDVSAPSGQPLVCGTGNLCMAALPCYSDEMCAGTMLCTADNGTSGTPTCAPPGSANVGERCLGNADCASGVCEAGVCLARCRATRDCTGGLLCAETRGGDQLGCMVSTDCGTTCGSDQYCDRGYCHEHCVANADCAGPNACLIRRESYCLGQGKCRDLAGLTGCASDEVRVAEYTGEIEPYCFVAKACWVDADCADPYGCVGPAGLRLCGRPAPSLDAGPSDASVKIDGVYNDAPGELDAGPSDACCENDAGM